MDLHYNINIEEEDYDVFIDASKHDLEYLHKLAITFLLEQGMFPFKLLSNLDACNFHQPPETIQ